MREGNIRTDQEEVRRLAVGIHVVDVRDTFEIYYALEHRDRAETNIVSERAVCDR